MGGGKVIAIIVTIVFISVVVISSIVIPIAVVYSRGGTYYDYLTTRDSDE